MNSKTASILMAALTAAKNGFPPDRELESEIRKGGTAVKLLDLNFDSLAWMEFCICIELETGAELTPDLLDDMESLHDVAEWLNARGVA